ncbi:hypothetical protein U1Q18_027159 [Sarracenia purpurea var. burkii]
MQGKRRRVRREKKKGFLGSQVRWRFPVELQALFFDCTEKTKCGDRICAETPSSTAVAPTSERIPTLCSGARISERGSGFRKEEDESEAHGLVWHPIKLG